MPERDYRLEYEALARALVGDTGQSATLTAHRLRSENMKLTKENERLRESERALREKGRREHKFEPGTFRCIACEEEDEALGYSPAADGKSGR